MNKIKEDECYEYYEALFEGYKVSFKVEKNIKESIINLLMIVMVMSHFGMQIRKNEISAKEYAFMVKRMCEDMKSARWLFKNK